MWKVVILLATLGLTLSLGGCAASPTPEGGCAMCATCCKSEGKDMKCEKKEKSAGCCEKGGAEGKSKEEHQH